MKNVVLVIIVAVLLVMTAWAVPPDVSIGAAIEEWELPVPQSEQPQTVAVGYSDAELNTIANVVNGEVGGICGTVVLTYADGSQLYSDACLLRKIHARIVDNQVKSAMFPSTVQGCVGTYWSTAYTGAGWVNSSQWESCRADVINALDGGVFVPNNVYAATCDSCFASYYPGYRLWARVDWNTGWYSGTFYYYQYG